jgi:hypothetical protein
MSKNGLAMEILTANQPDLQELNEMVDLKNQTLGSQASKPS